MVQPLTPHRSRILVRATRVPHMRYDGHWRSPPTRKAIERQHCKCARTVWFETLAIPRLPVAGDGLLPLGGVAEREDDPEREPEPARADGDDQVEAVVERPRPGGHGVRGRRRARAPAGGGEWCGVFGPRRAVPIALYGTVRVPAGRGRRRRRGRDGGAHGVDVRCGRSVPPPVYGS